MQNPPLAEALSKNAFILFFLQRLGAFLFFVVGGVALRAEISVGTEDLRPVLSALIGQTEHNFSIYRGAKVSGDQNATYFQAKPIPGMVSGAHYIAFIKGSYYYIGSLTTASSMRTAHDAFFAMPGFADANGTYTVEPDKAMSNAEKDVSDLLLNGNKIATYAQFHSGKEGTLSIGPFVNNTAERNDQAAAGVPAGDLRAVFSMLISETEHNFETFRGEKAAGDENAVYYQAKGLTGMVAGAHYVALIKGRHFFISDLTAAASVKAARDAFFAMPGYAEAKGSYALEADKAATNEKKEVTNLLLNGLKVAVYAKYAGDKEDTLTIGSYVASPVPESPTAEIDAKTKAFTAGAQILVRAAAGDFSGLTRNLIRKTADGDSLFVASPVPEMQTEADGQVMLLTENRYFYMNSYDTEADVAFAFASFLALPKNIAQDQAYKVEIDHRLDGAGSTTYHLRYNGEIVADFIKFKTKPKAFFTFGYRDGIPKGLVMGRTYSEKSIAEAKQMINAATTCANCRGLGVEEIDTGWQSKNSGIHEKKWVPCHYCHGTGHL